MNALCGDFMQVVVSGPADLEAGCEVFLDEVCARFSQNWHRHAQDDNPLRDLEEARSWYVEQKVPDVG